MKLRFHKISVLVITLLFVQILSFQSVFATVDNPSDTTTSTQETTVEPSTEPVETTTESTEPTPTPTDTTPESTSSETTTTTTTEVRGTITVHYVDENDRALTESSNHDLLAGRYEFQAINIDGYELISPVSQFAEISEAIPDTEITFVYRELPAPTPQPTATPQPTTTMTEPASTTSVSDTEAGMTDQDDSGDADAIALVDIKLIRDPNKTIYKVGDELDLTGILVQAVYSDGSVQDLSPDQFLVSGFNSEKPDEVQMVNLSFDDYSISFPIIIEKAPLRSLFSWKVIIPVIVVLLLIAAAIIFLVTQGNSKKSPTAGKKMSRKAAAAPIGEPIGLKKNTRSITQPSRNPIKTSRKRRRIPGWLIAIAIIIIILLLIYGGILLFLGKMERAPIATDDDSLGISDDVGDKDIFTVAVFGIDSTDGVKGRSDAIMLLTLDEKNDKIKITSIVRDSYVDIPDRGLDKINHAYAFGGPELAIRTINQNFDLDIRHYVTVNFSSMPKIIDAIGGVTITLTDTEAQHVSGISSGGTHILTGPQALQYARIRKIDSDFERSRRQRDVMESTINAAFDVPVAQYPGMLSDIFPLLTTNLTSNRILSTGTKAVTSGIRDIEKTQFPPAFLGKGQMINGIYYYVFDRETGKQLMHDYIFDDQPIAEVSDTESDE
ncbi:MAG: LCP family protein [Eubacteriales bacterium]|nr:LCP family protein [Eubacteriales bacterium]